LNRENIIFVDTHLKCPNLLSKGDLKILRRGTETFDIFMISPTVARARVMRALFIKTFVNTSV